MIESFHHVGISVSDLERAIAFYRDVFDMDQACEIFDFGGPHYAAVMGLADPRGRMCVMARGNLMLELFAFSHPAPAVRLPDSPVSERGYSHFGMVVSDIEGTQRRMAAAGVRFHSPVTQFPGGMKASYGRDPDGNVFEIIERCG